MIYHFLWFFPLVFIPPFCFFFVFCLIFAGSHITDEEIKLSEDKFAESLHLAQMGMFNLLENDVSRKAPVFLHSVNLYYYDSYLIYIINSALNNIRIQEVTLRCLVTHWPHQSCPIPCHILLYSTEGCAKNVATASTVAKSSRNLNHMSDGGDESLGMNMLKFYKRIPNIIFNAKTKFFITAVSQRLPVFCLAYLQIKFTGPEVCYICFVFKKC